jgi:hypothetical protein
MGVGGYKKVVERRTGNSSPAKSSNAPLVTGKNTLEVQQEQKTKRETEKIKFFPY